MKSISPKKQAPPSHVLDSMMWNLKEEIYREWTDGASPPNCPADITYYMYPEQYLILTAYGLTQLLLLSIQVHLLLQHSPKDIGDPPLGPAVTQYINVVLAYIQFEQDHGLIYG